MRQDFRSQIKEFLTILHLGQIELFKILITSFVNGNGPLET
jgi:hypothetical protein